MSYSTASKNSSKKYTKSLKDFKTHIYRICISLFKIFLTEAEWNNNFSKGEANETNINSKSRVKCIKNIEDPLYFSVVGA